MTTLIIGAREHSLGSALRSRWAPEDQETVTAGLSNEDLVLDATDAMNVGDVLKEVQPHIIVATVGINAGVILGHQDYRYLMEQSMMVNCIATMGILDSWIRLRSLGVVSGLEQFIVVSSNSAHIARTGSAAYCASKAALSMAVRVAARELKGQPLVYGYEFGLLSGTPMTASTEKRFGPSQTRMPGAEHGLSVDEAAVAMVNNMMDPWMGLNGCLLRFDAGEQ